MKENITKQKTKNTVSTSPENFKLNNSILDRLMNEVKNEKITGNAYDRTHNRHNRGQ